MPSYNGCRIMKSNKKKQKLMFCSLALLFVGCAMSPSNPNSPNTFGSGCPVAPLTELDEKNIRYVKLGDEPTIESAQIGADQSIGYVFDGKAKQKLSYKADNICVWVYRPDNKLLSQVELPMDGKYIIQIGIPQGVSEFNLEMSLSNPHQVLLFGILKQEKLGSKAWEAFAMEIQ
jgi:hypothetical protein